MKYIIITPNLSGIGGAEIYTLKRYEHLTDKGYNVLIITGEIEPFILKDKFRNAQIYCNTIFLHHPHFNSFRKRNKIYNYFINNANIDKKEEVIIESHSLNSSLHAEYISNKLTSKHLTYLLNEQKITSKYYCKKTINYYLDKCIKGELIGINSKTIPIVFNNSNVMNNYINIGFDTRDLTTDNQIIDELINQSDGFRIGTISRLEKKYLYELYKVMSEMSANDIINKYNLFIIGDSNDKAISNKIKTDFKNTKNFNVHLLGYINPLSKSFFKNIHVFVGMGTSAVNSISSNCPTIVVDPSNNRCSGIFGIDTSNFAYPDDGIYYDLDEKIKEILFNKDKAEIAKKRGVELFYSEFDQKSIMNKIDAYIINIETKKNTVKFKRTTSSYLHLAIFFIFGDKLHKKILR